MPQNPNFTLNSDTLGTVFKTVGVLMADGAEQSQTAILGAYYDSAPETQGLYVVKPDGSILYFDIDVVNLASQGTTELIRFDEGDTNYLLRTLLEEDGIWLSDCKMPIPVKALESKIAEDSLPAIAKYLGVEIDTTDSIPSFEGLFAYYAEGVENITALNYLSSYGSYARTGGDWVDEDISADYYAELNAVQVANDSCASILESYDSNKGRLPVKDVLKDESPVTQ